MTPDCRAAQNFGSHHHQLKNQATRDRRVFRCNFSWLHRSNETGTPFASLNLSGQWRSGRMNA
jgi:hypothetical protein